MNLVDEADDPSRGAPVTIMENHRIFRMPFAGDIEEGEAHIRWDGTTFVEIHDDFENLTVFAQVRSTSFQSRVARHTHCAPGVDELSPAKCTRP